MTVLHSIIEGETVIYQKKPVGLTDKEYISCLKNGNNVLQLDKKEVKPCQEKEDMVKEVFQKEVMAGGWHK